MHSATRLVCGICTALVFVAPCFGAEAPPPFTPEQRAYIDKLLERQKQEVRDEILQALNANPSGPIAKAATPPRNAALSETEAAPSAPNAAFFTTPALAVHIDEVTRDRAGAEPASSGMVGVASPAAYYYSRPSVAGSDIQEPKNSVQIQSSTAGSDATLLLTVAQKHLFDAQQKKLSSHLFTIKATAPFDDKKNRADFATLDGFPTGLSVKVGFNKTWSRLKDEATSQDTDELYDLAHEKCSNLDTKASCLDAVARGWQTLLPRAFKWGHALDIHVGAARNGYDHFNPALTKVSDIRFSWLIGGSYGVYNQKRDQFYAAGFDLVRGYTPDKEHIYCPPGGGAENVECVQGRFAPPKNNVSRLLYLETRQIWGWPLSVRLTRDLARDETGIDIPIYFAQNKDKKFDGGFRVGWTSTDHFQAGVFVGTTFDMPDR
jgi:hypothetical protein